MTMRAYTTLIFILSIKLLNAVKFKQTITTYCSKTATTRFLASITDLGDSGSPVVDYKTTKVPKKIKYEGLHHCGVIVSDVTASLKFYMDMFGCTDESFRRPSSLPYPGAFLRFGKSEVHLMQLPNVDPTTGRPAHGGRDRHVALTVNDIDLIKERYEDKGLPYTYSQSGRRAIFCRDLDGNAFEFMEDVRLDETLA